MAFRFHFPFDPSICLFFCLFFPHLFAWFTGVQQFPSPLPTFAMPFYSTPTFVNINPVQSPPPQPAPPACTAEPNEEVDQDQVVLHQPQS